ncbi:hypothetical protein GGX14DRAFT_391977 [Mycena pura]|uniref:Uncharacterized protein n=1 Tax=Mycena pura TaxID=153505 RepID=A0AAD6VKG1_9AGAR|nr:hypothetical protein GGX14DRAFT_391977 [Mycena pura]
MDGQVGLLPTLIWTPGWIQLGSQLDPGWSWDQAEPICSLIWGPAGASVSSGTRTGGRTLRVAVPPAAPSGAAINLIAANAPNPGHPYVGAVDSSFGDLEAGFSGAVTESSLGNLRTVAYLSGTSGDSPPSVNAGTSLTLNGHGGVKSQTLRVTAQWTSADGGHPATTIFYDPLCNFLGLTGDLTAYNTAASTGALAVESRFCSHLDISKFDLSIQSMIFPLWKLKDLRAFVILCTETHIQGHCHWQGLPPAEFSSEWVF